MREGTGGLDIDQGGIAIVLGADLRQLRSGCRRHVVHTMVSKRIPSSCFSFISISPHARKSPSCVCGMTLPLKN